MYKEYFYYIPVPGIPVLIHSMIYGFGTLLPPHILHSTGPSSILLHWPDRSIDTQFSNPVSRKCLLHISVLRSDPRSAYR